MQVCEFYMMRGHFPELIALLESGIGLERAHMGIFTALGEMYANHEPPKLMEHLKLFCTRVNIPRLITICDRQMLWRELTFLYEKVRPPPLLTAGVPRRGNPPPACCKQ